VAERESIEQWSAGHVFTGSSIFVLKIYRQMYRQKKF